ncbi:MAG: dihydropteroate synthase [Enterobacteriaceae bacterium]
MQLRSRGSVLDLSVPRIMGVLNITPDSFYEGSRYATVDMALRRAQEMVEAGVAIIDVGGESTRPGSSTEFSEQQELERVLPVIEGIRRYFDVWISVDTSRPQVIREVTAAGVHLINDIRALQVPGALEAVAESDLPVCLMHMQKQPDNMQEAPHYDDVVAEVKQFLQAQIDRCMAAGISRERLVLDPGFGFGKTLTHNCQLLGNLHSFHKFNLPLLVGMSRKTMVGQILNLPPEKRLTGSLACAVIAAMQGMHILRVHDVTETIEAVRIVEAVHNSLNQDT